ncbi:hypothetical protein ASF06_06715 [Agreia sp. Leaf244]|nr:hypothetical protein ASE64_07770 [Agreia sp. Leaf210]KQO09933.1 hypothetical protein ASF06_06715 [Agreia sp. Leaf244]
MQRQCALEWFPVLNFSGGGPSLAYVSHSFRSLLSVWADASMTGYLRRLVYCAARCIRMWRSYSLSSGWPPPMAAKTTNVTITMTAMTIRMLRPSSFMVFLSMPDAQLALPSEHMHN